MCGQQVLEYTFERVHIGIWKNTQVAPCAGIVYVGARPPVRALLLAVRHILLSVSAAFSQPFHLRPLLFPDTRKT